MGELTKAGRQEIVGLVLELFLLTVVVGYFETPIFSYQVAATITDKYLEEWLLR